jgi:hypothetical protein
VARRSFWPALACSTGLAAIGGVVAVVLASSDWVYLGVAIGAVTGPFAPPVYDAIRKRGAGHEELQQAFEQAPPHSLARLLGPG